MTKFTPPASGGSFELQKNGGLKQVKKPTQDAKKPAPVPSPKPATEQEA
ncbi:hypothetical protein [Pseudophaeobacter sp.]|nr:hypothetical protein [Pseudophaeobacter sp.]